MVTDQILIIDDDVELCEELSDTLKLEGFSVTYVSDSIQVEKIISNPDFGTIILDYRLSGLSGIDILKKMKEKNIEKKVILISGRPSVKEILEKEGLHDLISRIIPKPIDLETLLKKIKGP